MYGTGWTELIELPQPAVGAVGTYKIPGETFTRVVAGRARLVTSAVVANRFPALDVLDGDGTIVLRVMSPTAVVASTTRDVSFISNLGVSLTSGFGEDALPFSDGLFPPGFQIRVSVGGIDVGDQLSGLSLLVWRVPSGPEFESPGATPYRL